MDEVDYLLAGGIHEGLVVQRPAGTAKIDINKPGNGGVTTYTVAPPIHRDNQLYAIAIHLNVSEDHLNMLIRKAVMRPIPQ